MFRRKNKITFSWLKCNGVYLLVFWMTTKIWQQNINNRPSLISDDLDHAVKERCDWLMGTNDLFSLVFWILLGWDEWLKQNKKRCQCRKTKSFISYCKKFLLCIIRGVFGPDIHCRMQKAETQAPHLSIHLSTEYHRQSICSSFTIKALWCGGHLE